MLDLDKLASILVILIMLLELVILFKAILIKPALGLGLWLLFQGLDVLIRLIHERCFRENRPFPPQNGRK